MHYREVLSTARKLRRNPTPAERFMWTKVRGKRLNGYKFRRQSIIKVHSEKGKQQYYIADFYNSQSRLVIELDGKFHNFSKGRDGFKDCRLRDHGYHVMRFENQQILENWDEIRRKILHAVELYRPR